MTEPEVPEGYHEERWVFLGEYAGSKTKRLAAFRSDDGDTHSYKWGSEHSGLAVGYYYTVLVNDARSTRGTPGWTGDKADDLDEIRMQARAREREREDKLAQDRARTKDPDLERVLEVVNDYAARFTKRSSRDALIALLTRQVYIAKRRT